MAHELTSFADRVEMQHFAEKGRAFLDKLNAPTLTPIEPKQGPLQHRRRVVTVHSRYGQPPGELAYIETQDWNVEQQAEAARWLRNEQSKDWWRGQAAAQRAAS